MSDVTIEVIEGPSYTLEVIAPDSTSTEVVYTAAPTIQVLNAGQIGLKGDPGATLNPEGEWSAALGYEFLDTVTYQGGSYWCILDLAAPEPPALSIDPPHDTVHWQYLALIGDTGPTGATGPTGNTGATGPGVPSGGIAGDSIYKVSGTDFATEWATESTERFVGPASTVTLAATPLRIESVHRNGQLSPARSGSLGYTLATATITPGTALIDSSDELVVTYLKVS